jgi:hypothetical protein
MARLIFLAALALAGSACSGAPSYVVRLNLDQIAADTAARDSAPGFASLSR